MKQKIKRFIPYFLVVLAIALPWFFQPGFLFFRDFVFGPRIDLNWASPWFFHNLIVKLLSFILPLGLIQKLFISFILLVVLFGAKKITNNFCKDKRYSFIIGLFALFNPFVYYRLMYGQVGVIAAFGFLCWGVGFLLEYLKKQEEDKSLNKRKRIKLILYSGICFALAIQFSAHFIFFIAVFCPLFFALNFMFSVGKKRYAFLHLMSIGIIIFIFNANWIFGALFTNTPAAVLIRNGIAREDLLAFQTAGANAGEAIKNVITLQGFWGDDLFKGAALAKIQEIWKRSFWLILVFAGWGVVQSQKSNVKSQKYLGRGLIILWIGTVILAAGIRIPGGQELTYFLFEHFPFYKGLRESQKWVSVILVVYLIFLVMGLGDLIERKFFKRKFLWGILLGGLIVMQAPVMIWGFNGEMKAKNYPLDWQEIDSFIRIESYKDSSSEKCEKKILFLPWHMYMEFKFAGGNIANPAKLFFGCPVISGTNIEFGGIYDQSGTLEGKFLKEWIEMRGVNKTLKELKINYIILAKEVDWKEYEWLDIIPGIKLLKETENLKLYSSQKL